MSYCRWSTNSFRCDVYAYHSVSGGVAVCVAVRRHRLWFNLFHRLRDWALYSTCRVLPFRFRCPDWASWPIVRICGAIIHPLRWPGWLTHYRIPLEIPDDRFGLSFAAAADWLEELRQRGFILPQEAIDELRYDAELEALQEATG